MRSRSITLTIGIAALITALMLADDPKSAGARAQQDALSAFQQYIGAWRGVGQPKRGSAKDAWSEQCEWAWNFDKGIPTFTLVSSDGKYLRKATLKSVGKNQYELTGQSAEVRTARWVGSPDDDGNLVLVADPEVDGMPARITIRMVAGGDRLLMLYERRTEGDRFARLAEVGMTRKGSGFGQGTTYVECVVTGGLGTIPVMHAGQTYYVCCSGCRDHFEANPDEVLAEYRERKAEEKRKKDAAPSP